MKFRVYVQGHMVFYEFLLTIPFIMMIEVLQIFNK